MRLIGIAVCTMLVCAAVTDSVTESMEYMRFMVLRKEMVARMTSNWNEEAAVPDSKLSYADKTFLDKFMHNTLTGKHDCFSAMAPNELLCPGAKCDTVEKWITAVTKAAEKNVKVCCVHLYISIIMFCVLCSWVWVIMLCCAVIDFYNHI